MKIFCEKNLFLITINIETGFIKIQTSEMDSSSLFSTILGSGI